MSKEMLLKNILAFLFPVEIDKLDSSPLLIQNTLAVSWLRMPKIS